MNRRNGHLTFQTLFSDLTRPENGIENRESPRWPFSVELRIQPLDLDYRPDGDPFWVTSRDISDWGAGVICVEPISHDFVRIELPEYDIQTIARVCHNTSIGEQYPLYLIGLQFVDD